MLCCMLLTTTLSRNALHIVTTLSRNMLHIITMYFRKKQSSTTDLHIAGTVKGI